MKKEDLPERKRPLINGYKESPFVVIFSDLDGTLLDPMTYGWEEAKPALKLCDRYRFPIILTSSKTRAEILFLQECLKISAPFIAENGGGIFFPEHESYKAPPDANPVDHLWKLSLGVPYSKVVSAFQEIRMELGCDMKGFSQMSLEEISRLTGLDIEASRRAAMREYDEPFVIFDKQETSVERLGEAAMRKGLRVTTGGRFCHLHGDFDKGLAVRRVEAWYRTYHERLFTIALGDSPNDFDMLRNVDLPVLVRSSRPYGGLQKSIRGLRTTKEAGPRGWNRAIIEILGDKAKGG